MAKPFLAMDRAQYGPWWWPSWHWCWHQAKQVIDFCVDIVRTCSKYSACFPKWLIQLYVITMFQIAMHHWKISSSLHLIDFIAWHVCSFSCSIIDPFNLGFILDRIFKVGRKQLSNMCQYAYNHGSASHVGRLKLAKHWCHFLCECSDAANLDCVGQPSALPLQKWLIWLQASLLVVVLCRTHSSWAVQFKFCCEMEISTRLTSNDLFTQKHLLMMTLLVHQD